MTRTFLDGRVVISVGDITKVPADAIVNAANSSLLGGGGVDGAIHRVGGAAILAACRELRRSKFPQGLPTGEAAITTAGELPARYVIHTVGPIWAQHSDAARLLASCYRRCLEVAGEHDCRSVAFPAISTGIYGYPKEAAAEVASRTIAAVLQAQSFERLEFVFFSRNDADIFLRKQRFESSQVT